jgi:beta-ureidopropionase / N-carbamoyl-L-amino-acid hydrolase
LSATDGDCLAQLSGLNGDRLFETLGDAARIGRWRTTGVRRLALDDADRAMRDAFCGWCADSGLDVGVDRVGNVFARRDGTEDEAPVMIGSHLDTQVAGGRYDGALGVLAGLELVRALDDHGIATRRPIVVANWSNEEGARFQPPMLGSSAYAGAIELGDALAATDQDGTTFGGELRRIGYDGERPIPGPPPAAYFEFHIEQGAVLDRRGLDLGIVTTAYPSRGTVLRFRGETAHAGATSMRHRHDALVGAAELVIALDALAADGGDEVRATVPQFDAWPNRPGIVAGEATITVDVRHADGARLERLCERVDEIRADVARRRGLEVTVERSWRFGSGISFDGPLAAAARRAAADLDVTTIDMPSTAGHDAYAIAAVAPTLILFAPCLQGITHNEHEDVDPERVLRAADVLARVVLETAQR